MDSCPSCDLGLLAKRILKWPSKPDARLGSTWLDNATRALLCLQRAGG